MLTSINSVNLLLIIVTCIVFNIEISVESVGISPKYRIIDPFFIMLQSSPESEYVGKPIPDDVLNEELTTEDYTNVTLKGILDSLPNNYKGVVLFLFPAVNTPHCTKQACSFNESNKNFNELGYGVYGLTSTQRSSPKKWSLKHNLSYPLLIDKNWKLINYLDCKKLLYFVNRSHLVIGKNARILGFERGVNAMTSSSRMLELVKKLHNN